jgi:hypothetical protein
MSESTLTPQAPLDLGRLETEAKLAATKYVANLLQVCIFFHMRLVFSLVLPMLELSSSIEDTRWDACCKITSFQCMMMIS